MTCGLCIHCQIWYVYVQLAFGKNQKDLKGRAIIVFELFKKIHQNVYFNPQPSMQWMFGIVQNGIFEGIKYVHAEKLHLTGLTLG